MVRARRALTSSRGPVKRSIAVALALGAISTLASACSHPHDAPPKCAPTPEAAPAPTAVAASSSSWSAADSPACAAPDGRDPPLALDGAPLVVLCRGLYADPATSPADRHALARWYDESLVGLASVLGTAKTDPPLVVACKSDACSAHFAGPTRRSRAMLAAKPRPMVVISGPGSLTKGTTARCWTASIEPGDWNGAIDAVRVYNYALSPDQVTSDLRGP